MEPEIQRQDIIKSELANGLTHGIGILFGIASIPLVVALAARSNNIHSIIGVCVYGFCFLMLFTFSTLYHGFQQPHVKQVLLVFDYISIYFFIAGTYTPFILNYLYNTTGIVMLCVLWGLVLVGIIFKIYFSGRLEILSTIIYLLMGWMMVWGGKQFFVSLPVPVMVMVVTGGGLYTIGVIFYLMEKWKWHHLVWHSLVLAAALCHYVAVLLTVA
jgi:channel protein, hemolysin III family